MDGRSGAATRRRVGDRRWRRQGSDWRGAQRGEGRRQAQAQARLVVRPLLSFKTNVDTDVAHHILRHPPYERIQM